MLQSLITKADVLSNSPQQRVNKETSYKTLMGGLIIISIFILTFIGIGYFGRELFIKEQPFVVISDREYEDVGPFEVKINSFYFYVAVQMPDFTFYNDPTIFEFVAYIDKWYYDANGTAISSRDFIEISTCNNYFNNTSELFMKRNIVDLDVFYCIKPGLH